MTKEDIIIEFLKRHHTKIMLNSVGARPKSSRLENLMNKEVLTIFIIQVSSLLRFIVFKILEYLVSLECNLCDHLVRVLKGFLP